MIRSSKSLALSVALGVIAAAGFAGCVASEEGTEDALVEHELVTQEDVASLQAGELLSLPLQENRVYALDYSTAPIDYARIKLSTPKGKEVLLAEQMAAVESLDYGEYPAPVFVDEKVGRFSVASDEAAFGKLSARELDQLRTDGFFYTEEPASVTGAKPQTTDPDECVHAFCEVCVDNETGGWPETWLPGSYTCYLIEHVWC